MLTCSANAPRARLQRRRARGCTARARSARTCRCIFTETPTNRAQIRLYVRGRAAPSRRRCCRRRRRRNSIYRKTKPGQCALYYIPLSNYKVLSEDQLPCVRDSWARGAAAAATSRMDPHHLLIGAPGALLRPPF
jgi:hypothetical protein